MPSPFPGMNPYLESADTWPDFHMMFLSALRARLGVLVRPRYLARGERSLYVETDTPRRRFGVADVAITEQTGGVAVADPAVAPMVRATVPIPGVTRQRRVVVRDAQSREVVTVIELLSPANKVGAGRAAYLRKRNRVLRSHASLVELDFLRGGERMPVTASAADYSVLVSRPVDRPEVDFWPVSLRGRLPAFRVPLRPGDAEPVLDLQAVLHETYDAAGYATDVYGAPPDPPLVGEDAVWAAGILAGGG